MSPRTRSMANPNRNGNDATNDRDDEATAQSQSSTPRLQIPSGGSSPSSSSSLGDEESDGPPQPPIPDSPPRQARARLPIWRQQIYRQFRPARSTFWVVLATAFVFLLPWSFFFRPDWTLDATIPDFHIVNDPNLLCHCINYGYSPGYIPVGYQAPNRLSPPLRMSPRGKSISISSSSSSSNGNSSGSSSGGETVGIVEVGGLRYDNAPLRAIGHVHLQLCTDDRATGRWWHMNRCNRTELFTLDPVLFIRTAKTNRISFGLLARNDRDLGKGRSLPLGVWRDGKDGSVVVSGKIIKASLRQVFRKRSVR